MTIETETMHAGLTEKTRRALSLRDEELEAKRAYEDLQKARAEAERDLLDALTEAEVDGISVDGRLVYVRSITTAKLKEGVDIRSKEFRAALEEYELAHLLDPKISSRDLGSAMRQLSEMFGGEIPDDAKILDFVDLGAVYALGNKKA